MIKKLPLSDAQVAIDGVVYDLSDFPHPGGPVLQVFGGNDVTAAYHLIHTSHAQNPHHYLGKLKRVGELPDYKPDYTFDSAFSRDLRESVAAIVPKAKSFGTPGYFFRAAFYISLMAVLQWSFSFRGSSVSVAFLLGCSAALIGICCSSFILRFCSCYETFLVFCS